MSDDTAICTTCGRDNDYGTHSALEVTGHLSHPYTPYVPTTIDAAHIERQRAWSTTTFGPGPRTEGVIDHITKEFDEIRADPTDLKEWVDVIILALDGAQRTGVPVQDIIDAIHAKQERNEKRKWPDWRTAPEGKAIEHDRSQDAVAPNEEAADGAP